MDEPKKIPVETRWTTAGFMQRYEELIQTAGSYFKAYQAAEAEHIALFGKSRYSNYHSFRMTRNERIIKNK